MSKIISMFAALVLSMAMVMPAHAEFKWQHFGADPYAATRAEAMRTRESAFRKLGLPKPVVKLLMEATQKPGEKIRLVMGDRLSAMLSKGSIVHRNVTVAFVKPPISGKMEYAAPAEKWQVTFEGKTYSVILPEICYNWSSIVTTAPRALPALHAATPLQCATVKYTVVPGDLIRFAVLAQKRLPSSACWQLCDGVDCAAPPSPCDDCDWIGPKSVIPTGFEPLHTGRYVARAAHQSLRFPREIQRNYVALCDSREGLGESDSWIVQPSAWQVAEVLTVPYGGQEWPVWGQVDMSKWRKP